MKRENLFHFVSSLARFFLILSKQCTKQAIAVCSIYYIMLYCVIGTELHKKKERERENQQKLGFILSKLIY